MRIREELYILKRRIIAIDNWLVSFFCGFMPINNNKIAIYSYEGKGGFGCNPRYIVEELHKRNDRYEFIWIVNDTSKEFPTYVKPVKNTKFNRCFQLATSRVWINNYRFPYGTKKRKGQYYIQTWHSGMGFKRCGLLRGNAFSKMAYLVSKNDSDMIDCTVIDSEWSRDVWPDSIIYYGNYELTGSARCDVFFEDKNKFKNFISREFGIDEDFKICLFAPTYREMAKNGKRGVYSEVWSIDLVKLLSELESKFEGNWYIGIRVHPQLSSVFEDYVDDELKGKILNLSKYDDLYQILPAVDMVITDYSSLAFDAGVGKIPVILYADDIEKYVNDRGGLLWDLSDLKNGHIRTDTSISPRIDVELPFVLCQNNKELQAAIREYDYAQFERDMQNFITTTGTLIDGNASFRIANIIENEAYKENILMKE